MTKSVPLIAVFCVTALMGAQRPYDVVMKEAGSVCGSLKKNLEAKKSPEAAADAKKLDALFQELHKHWKKTKTADAMKLSLDASAASREVGKALKASNMEQAQAAFKNVTATCKPCHDAHREKGADGKWKVKAD